jgi:solute carrier family 35 (UDP-galactose transporter), member B1
MIPTMVMGLLLEQTSYSSSEWIAAMCITVGIVLFHLSTMGTNISHGSRETSRYGLFLLAFSLLCDGLLGSCQGLLKRLDTSSYKRRPPSAVETMLFVNLYALLVLVPMAYLSGEWEHGIAQWDNVKTGVWFMNASAAAGQIFIFLTITWFSPLVCTTITTTRKFFTILLSVVYFGHRFTGSQWASVGLVFGGLFVGLQNKPRIDDGAQSTLKTKKE